MNTIRPILVSAERTALRQSFRVAAVRAAAALAAACTLALPAHAQEVGWHPATSAHAQRVGDIDPNTFILGHPASPTTRGGHANFPHPAVVVAGRVGPLPIDPNTFIVQPPASVTWLPVAPAEDSTRVAGAPTGAGAAAH